MVLTPDSYALQCSCGKAHQVLLQKAVIQPGALLQLNRLCAEAGLTGPLAAVYDANTYKATGGRRPAVALEAVLKPEGLHADEHGVAALEKALDEAGFGAGEGGSIAEQTAAGGAAMARPARALIAIGSGTVHDITRYVAAKRGLPFVSAPTAASVDGFVSTVAAMTWHGFKKTLPGVSPCLLAADLDVIAAAPFRLTAAGVGDILGKYVSLADWRLASLLTGEYYCEGIEGLTRAAVDEVLRGYKGLAAGRADAYESLVKALVLSGVAMQLAGNSRPASAAEHHISHFIEIGVPGMPPSDALHGEKVGVGTLLALTEYHRFAALGADGLNTGALAGYTPPGLEELAAEFGPLAGEVQTENQPDCLAAVEPGVLYQKWGEVQALLAALPQPAEIEAVLQNMGAKRTLADLGVPEDKRDELLYWSPYVRNRLTFMRVRHALVQGNI